MKQRSKPAPLFQVRQPTDSFSLMVAWDEALKLFRASVRYERITDRPADEWAYCWRACPLEAAAGAIRNALFWWYEETRT